MSDKTQNMIYSLISLLFTITVVAATKNDIIELYNALITAIHM